MLHSLSRNIAVFLFDVNDKFPLEVYIYGIEICLSSLIGIIAILIISFYYRIKQRIFCVYRGINSFQIFRNLTTNLLSILIFLV